MCLYNILDIWERSMNIHLQHFLRKNRSTLICILLAVVIFVCFVGPLWSYHSAQTKDYGEAIYRLTGQPIYSNYSHINDKSMTGNLRTVIICSFVCLILTLSIIALSIACLVIFGRTEYMLKASMSALFFGVAVFAMIMMIVIGGEIHQMEHPAVGPGTYGFLVGPGPICTFVFAMVGGIVNTTLLILRKDGYALKTMLHIQYKESLDQPTESPAEE